ncbi:MAG: MATE family efflux transporter [Agarilytica sp.]
MAVGIMATMSFNMVDTYFVAQLGDEALAAISFTFPVMMMGISLAVGLGAGLSSVVSRAAGAHDEDAVRALITDGISLTFLLALLFGVVGFLNIDNFFSAIGASDQILPLIRDYMKWWFPSLVFFILPMVGMAAIRALGNTQLQGTLMIGMALANAILDPFLIFGWWIFPRLEVEGAAIASLIVRVVAVAVTFYFMHIKMRLFVNPFNVSRIKESWPKILHVGIPAMATNLIIPFSGSVLVALVATHGNAAVAGFGVATRVESMALILFYALSAVIGPFCGQNLGAKKFQRLFDAQQITGLFCLYSGVFVAVVLAVFGKPIAALFSSDTAVIDTTYNYLLIVPMSYAAYGVVMVVNASFNGLGKPMPGVIISALRVIVVLLPLAWLANAYFGLNGVFVAIAATNILVGMGAFVWVNRVIGRTKHRALPDA